MSLGLERVSKALEKLGRPDKSMRCIHVAGSNGKGSVCAHLSSGLHRAGFKVGLFSSPHLAKIEERVRINGKPIDSGKFDEALVKVKSLDIDLTFFEITYLVSLIVCSEENVRYMILETGLGGRLDATRSAEVIGCLVTSVSLEHSDILGDTLELVAKEKAAIWRSGAPMLIRDPEIATVRNAMREEAVSAQFFLPDSHDFMEEAGDLAEKLKLCVRYFPELGIKGVIGGDFLSKKYDVKTETINEEKFYSFGNQSLKYGIPVDHPIGKKFKEAKVTIVFHTHYTGDDLEEMQAKPGFFEKLNDIKSVLVLTKEEADNFVIT